MNATLNRMPVSFAVHGVSLEDEAVPSESLVLACGAMQVTYWKQDSEGGLATMINPVKWSVHLNKAEFAIK